MGKFIGICQVFARNSRQLCGMFSVIGLHFDKNENFAGIESKNRRLNFDRSSFKGILVHISFFSCLFADCDPDHEFTCHDGTCIPLEDKCNDNEDCQNGEDEDDCGKSALFA